MTRHDIKLMKNLFTCTTVSTVTHRVPITIIQKGKMKEMQKDSTRLFASANRSPRLGSNEFSLKKRITVRLKNKQSKWPGNCQQDNQSKREMDASMAKQLFCDCANLTITPIVQHTV